MDSKELIWYKHNIKDVEFLGSKLRIKKSVPSIINRDKEYIITCKNENVIYQFVRCTLSREDSETDMTFDLLVNNDSDETLFYKIFMDE
mgnify:FL=1